MIDYAKLEVGQKLKVCGIGAPGFAKVGDLVTVKSVELKPNYGRCDVVHDESGKEAFFALSCGAARLEPAEPHNES